VGYMTVLPESNQEELLHLLVTAESSSLGERATRELDRFSSTTLSKAASKILEDRRRGNE
ncbi:MAG TPA: hypothetical protein VGG18_08360, partial [Granulicella sp.]